MKIHFIGIGAQKSGTTWIDKQLRKIPEFDLPPIKEIHYFDRSEIYPSSNRFTEKYFWKRIISRGYIKKIIKLFYTYFLERDFKKFNFNRKILFLNYNINFYKSLFNDQDGFTGEITPSYAFLNTKDIKEIFNLSPDLKLILILRNPVDRAWSHFRYSLRNKNPIPEITNSKIIEFINSDAQLIRGNYIKTINNYLSVFDKKQLLICFYDAISDNPKLLLKNIVKHICGNKKVSFDNIDYKIKVNISKKINFTDEINDYLKKMYHDEIKELSENYGGYFTKWYEETYNLKSTNKNRSLLPTFKVL